ncbi:MAG: acyltransferase [Pseudomonadota bacterium]
MRVFYSFTQPKGEKWLPKQIDIIQALRFLAAMLVVGVHLPPIGVGHFGVDLFFVLSGFIMAYTTAQRRPSALEFLRKRVVRVVPLYWLMTFLVFAAVALVPQVAQGTSATLAHLFQSLIFLPFDKNGMGHAPVLFVGWTLNYEMLFYCLFALALLIAPRHRIMVSAVLVTAIVLTCHGLEARTQIFALRAWASPMMFEFVLGLMVWAVLPENASPRLKLVLAGLVLFGFGFAALTGSMRLIEAGLPAALVLWGLLRFGSQVQLPPGLTLLGDASYALYLTHPFVIRAIEAVADPFHQPLTVVWVALLCVAVSLAVHLWIERPLTRVLQPAKKPKPLYP